MQNVYADSAGFWISPHKCVMHATIQQILLLLSCFLAVYPITDFSESSSTVHISATWGGAIEQAPPLRARARPRAH